MSGKGAVLTLRIEDERTDKYLTASAALDARLAAIKAYKQKNGIRPTTTTIEDITDTHELYIGKVVKPFVALASQYYKLKPKTSVDKLQNTATTQISFELPSTDYFIGDIALRLVFKALGDGGRTHYKYCAYPGIRIQERVSFTSDSQLIDEYTRDEYLAKISTIGNVAKRLAYERLLGQQEVKEARYYNNNEFTQVVHYADGAQTWKATQPELELIIPLDLFMCQDPANAIICSRSGKNGRVITIDLAKAADIVSAISSDHKTEQKIPTIRFEAELYINCLMTEPSIYGVMKTISAEKRMIRVHRTQRARVYSESEDIKLLGMNFPIEHITVSVRDPRNLLDPDIWHLGGRRRVRAGDREMRYLSISDMNNVFVIQSIVSAKESSTLDPLLKSLSLMSYNNTLFYEFSPLFYGSYLVNRYHEADNGIRVSDDLSTVMMPFSVFQGKHNPSGIYNASAGRELTLHVNTENVSSSAPADVLIHGRAINYITIVGDTIIRHNMV